MPVKQYPDVILYAVGRSALDGGRRLTLFAKFFFPPSSVCESKFVMDFQWLYSVLFFVFVFFFASLVVIFLCRWRNQFKLA